MATRTARKGLGAVVEIVRDGGTLKAMLLVSGHQGQATLAGYTDVAALLVGAGNDRVTASGYADVTITGVSVDETTTAGQATVISDPITYPTVGSGQTATQLCVYEFVTNDAGSRPLMFMDVSILTDGNDIVIDPNALGLWQAATA